MFVLEKSKISHFNQQFFELQLEKLTLHKIPVFREPDDDDEEANEEGNENEKGGGEPTNREKRRSEVAEREDFEKFTPEILDKVSSSEISSMLQKEEEYLKTLTPNLNTLQDYERKVGPFLYSLENVKIWINF